VQRNDRSEHDHKQDGDKPECKWRKHKARLDLARGYLALIAAGLGCAVGLWELVRAVFNH
jgi:hypothetical protein